MTALTGRQQSAGDAWRLSVPSAAREVSSGGSAERQRCRSRWPVRQGRSLRHCRRAHRPTCADFVKLAVFLPLAGARFLPNVQDFHLCPRGASRPRPWSRALHECSNYMSMLKYYSHLHLESIDLSKERKFLYKERKHNAPMFQDFTHALTL